MNTQSMVVTVDELLITGIQRFSVHDGPGIRTTVFLKGCTLRCPWCCNPENIRGEPEVYFKEEKCIGCLECVKRCSFLDKPRDIFRFPEHHECAGSCPSAAMGVYGEFTGADDVAEVILRDLDYYSSTGGGVTFSGGEPLLQADGILSVTRRIGEVPAAVETSLFAPGEAVEKLKGEVDLFLVDVKILDDAGCREVTGGDPEVFRRNFERISDGSFTVRFPAVKPYTFNRENIRALIRFLRENMVDRIEVLGIHRLGLEKYRSLNLQMPDFSAPDDAEIKKLKWLLEKESIGMNYLKI
ncbi:MAG: pyruvate formate lyase activating enzyme [Methanothermobacter sp.]|nr:pyruvate formate lyase activating enzyme [Methanothermobacter sp.]